MRPMTETEISAAAAADSDARPMTDAEWRAYLAQRRCAVLWG